MLNTSCPTLKIVLLLCSHHSCTLATGLTFSNTVSLNAILGFSPFNLHHFIHGFACSDVQRFLPYLLLLGQFWSPPIYYAFTTKCRTQLLIHVFPKRFVFILYTTHFMLTTISCNPCSILITGSLFLLTLTRSSFSSLDSTIPTPFHSCSFVPLRSNLHPPQLFRFVPLPPSLHSNLYRFHHIRQASVIFPSSSQHSNCPLSRSNCPNSA